MDITGQTIGQYRIIEPIGVGGMATVFKAYQPGLDRYVAVKVLPAQYALTPGFKERFIREAKAVAQLSHPNILPIYDVGLEGDLSYFVMKYVPGHTLGQLMGQPLSLFKVSHYIDQIAGAMDHAHRRGILHRDIKPSNILVEREENWLLLADFGLAKIVEGSVILTGAGAIMGTPAYVSPEQAGGKPVDHRTDIYSLGIVLYEMVTGQVPYEGETPMGVIVKHLIEPLPLPRSLNPDLPEKVERVILKALAKEPDNRYNRASELAKALRQAVDTSTSVQTAPVFANTTIPEVQTYTSPDLRKQTAPDQSEATVLSGQKRYGLPRWRWFAGGVLALLILAGSIAMIDNTNSSPPQDSSSKQITMPVATNTPTSTYPPPTATLFSTPVPTIDTDATSAAITEGVFATMTAVAPSPTDTPTVTQTPIPTDTSIPSAPMPTSMPSTVTPIYIPTIDADPAIYDNFDNPANDGNFNQILWRGSNESAGSIVQENGVLKIIYYGQQGNWTGLVARQYDGFQLMEPTFFEVKMMADYGGQDNNAVHLSLRTDSPLDIYTDCLYWLGDGDSPNIHVSLHCNYIDSQMTETHIIRNGTNVTPGTWHTLRIEVDPNTTTFTYFADGQLIGSHTPTNAEMLKTAKFSLEVGVWGPAPSEPFTGYIDDVKIGPIL